MSLLSGFANQTATLEVRTGKDGFDRPTYAAPRTIKVRRESGFGVVRTVAGTEVPVESYYLTEATVTAQDRIDGSVVRRVKDVISKGGKRLGCEVWV